MKNFLKKSIIPLFLLSLFILTLLTFFSLIFTYHRTVLKSVGIFINDDCHFKNISTLACSYIELTDRKRFFFDIRDVSLKFNIKNILDRSNIFSIYIGKGYGWIFPEKENRKKRVKKVSFKPLFYALNVISVKIKDFSINVEKKPKVKIKDFSIDISSNNIHTLRPVNIYIGKEKFTVKQFSGHYTKEQLKISNILILHRKGNIKISGVVKRNSYINISGEVYYPEFKDKALITGIEGNFFLKGDINERLKSFAKYSLKEVLFKENSAKNIEGQIYINLGKTVKGKNSLKIEEIKSNNVKAKETVLISSFDIKNGFFSRNKLIIKNIESKWAYFQNLSSNFILERKKSLRLKGDILYKGVKLGYEADFNEKKRLTILLPKYRLKKLLELFPLKRKLEYVDTYISGKYSLDIKKFEGSGNFILENTNLYGLFFKKGVFRIKNKIKNKLTYISFSIDNKNTFVDINGKIKNKELDLNIIYKNLDISSLIFAEKYNFGGIISGSGKIQGNVSDIDITLYGRLSFLRYKSISLENLLYNLRYRNKFIKISVNDTYKTIKTDIDILLNPFTVDIRSYLKNADLKPTYPFLVEIYPDVFRYVRPENATGQIEVSLKKKSYSVDFNIKRGKIFLIPAEDYIYTTSTGQIRKNKRSIKATFYRSNFKYRNRIKINRIKGLFLLNNQYGNISLETEGLSIFDRFHMFGSLGINIKKKELSGDIFTTFKYKDYKTVLNSSLSGSFLKLKGILYTEVYMKGKKFTENFLNYTFKKEKGLSTVYLKSDKLNFFLNNFLEFTAERGNGKITFGKSIKGDFHIEKITLLQNNIPVFKTSPISIVIENRSIKVNKTILKGLINGKVDHITYNIPEELLDFSAGGRIDKSLISQFILFGSVDKQISFKTRYRGKITELKKNLFLSIYSSDLRFRSSYLRGILHIKDLYLILKDGNAKIKLEAKTSSVLSGESNFSIKGYYNIKNKKNLIKAAGKLIPVRYPGIFEGSLNINLKTFSRETEQIVKGDISLTGRVRLEKNITEQMRKNKGGSSKENKHLEKIKLDVKMKTFTPVYIYGSWGNAYGEGNLIVTGTAKKPVVNGYINIVYGKIHFMKMKYNVDFAKIKIINNEPYISARVSTVVANTFIYININGDIKNPKISFSSVPPKSKREILSILLLKDTPATLESLPLLSTLGKIIYAFLPFGTEEDRGLFNTGFDVSITPSYDPLYGITASIYAKKNLTRRFYIAFSKPIREVEGVNIFGWYEIGVHITEMTSFYFRWYENSTEEIQFMFSLPFDFDFNLWRGLSQPPRSE